MSTRGDSSREYRRRQRSSSPRQGRAEQYTASASASGDNEPSRPRRSRRGETAASAADLSTGTGSGTGRRSSISSYQSAESHGSGHASASASATTAASSASASTSRYSARARRMHSMDTTTIMSDTTTTTTTTSATPTAQPTPAPINHEDEIERIRKMRATRLRNERGESASAARPTGEDRRSLSPVPSSDAVERVRERRREREAAKSTASISRRELEEAGLVRRERRPTGGRANVAATSPTRMHSEPVTSPFDPTTTSTQRAMSPRAGRRPRAVGGDEEDTASAYSRSRRERQSRDGDDDNLSAYARARRERNRRREDHSHDSSHSQENSAYSRSRRERQSDEDPSAVLARARERRERLTASMDDSASTRARREREDDDTTSAYSRNSDQSSQHQQPREREYRPRGDDARTRRQPQRSAQDEDVVERKDDRPPTRDRERHPPVQSRSIIGNEDFRAVAARERPKDITRLPPQRSKSADQDLLAMDLKRRNEEQDVTPHLSHEDRESNQPQTGSSRTRSTDLTTRLRERREARAAERAQSEAHIVPPTPSAPSRRNEVERRLARRRSNDDTLTAMMRSNITRNTADPNTDSTQPTLSDPTSPLPTVGVTPPPPTTGGKQPEYAPGAIPELEVSALADSSQPSWSVTISVLSAVDLPLNVVKNMPLCPVLKVGFVRIPDKGDIPHLLGDNSISAVQSARVRSTTSKIMSKRDNGSIDFYQEMRWDDVCQPTKVALYVELAARAVRTPINLEQSPPARNQPVGFDMLQAPSSPRPTKRIMAAVNNSPQRKTSTESNEPVRQVSRTISGSSDDDVGGGGLRALWRKATNRKAAELEAAEAAAAVARMLVEQDKQAPPGEPDGADPQEADQEPEAPQEADKEPEPDYNVAMENLSTESEQILTEDARIGALIVPLSKLPLEKATADGQIAQLEKWFQLEILDGDDGSSRQKKPSVLLEIKLSSPTLQDEKEEEVEQVQEDLAKLNTSSNALATHRQSIQVTTQTKEEKPSEESSDPVLEPGVVDFVAVLGCRDIGNQKADNGAKGWVDSSPECVILEQFPKNNEFHQRAGRNALLPEMIQWFAFPEGARLWRGTAPPSHADLNLKRFSASSPPNLAFSVAAFDACLNCTTSFSWFVIASNSDEYGSKLVKTYGAVIRFYAPAPVGIDHTQEDFAQSMLRNHQVATGRGAVKRLWVPIGICLTSSLPIVGIMEAMLLRLCEDLVTKVGPKSGQISKLEDIHLALKDLIVNFQRPIAGAVNCSVPFLTGERFLLSLPPPTGLPPLPHGKATISVCRLLGAEGLNYLLAAVLTECKILIHSQDIADIAMVAEVITALIYPFAWSLPYIPILPIGMLEFVEAPLSYILGIPSCNLQLLDPHALEDVVTIDLDNGFTSAEYLDPRRSTRAGRSTNNRSPTPLPATVAANISKAVYRLLRAEEEVDEEYGASNLGDQTPPRLESESLAEREFRVTVAIEICGLLRGYQECLGPVFNRDKFLKISPALFEERRDHKAVGTGLGSRPVGHGKVISPRSKRFLSALVNTQNFQQLLESLESEDTAFFHEVMEALDEASQEKGTVRGTEKAAPRPDKIQTHLVKALQKLEDKIPTYRVDRGDGVDDAFGDDDEFFLYDAGDILEESFRDFNLDDDYLSSQDPNIVPSFTSCILQPIDVGNADENNTDAKSVSMEYLERLEKNPWTYQQLFDINIEENTGEEESTRQGCKVKLRDAIGERRYRTWKMAQAQKTGTEVEVPFSQENLAASKRESALDLTSLISSASSSDYADTLALSANTNPLRSSSSLTPEQQKVVDAKDRDVIRRCLDRSNNKGRIQKLSGDDTVNPFMENGRDLLAEAEKALRNPSAQRFLLSILAQRSRLENQRARPSRRGSVTSQASASRLDTLPFDCLIRLSCALLDSCMEFKEYEAAYRLLTLTAGFFTLGDSGDEDDNTDQDLQGKQVITMTSRIGLHPIFADLAVWETVMNLHLVDRRSERKVEVRQTEEGKNSDEEEEEDELEYEAAVATLYEMVGYGIPGEELSRFAMRTSERNGWFNDDRGRQLLVLARRISVRRDQAESAVLAGDAADLDMIASRQEGYATSAPRPDEREVKWLELGWCHPSAPTVRSSPRTEKSGQDGPASPEDYMSRSPVTALASFGTSVVVTGGLDGGVFLAYSIGMSPYDDSKPQVNGIHLDWGSASRAGAGSSSDGEYGVGAVSCLAAAYGSGQHTAPQNTGPFIGDELMESMDGNRVVAGTTAGDLRVWSVKDVYSAVLASKYGEEVEGSGASGGTSVLTRLKFSLRGRALSGHRGGVTCMDLPSHMYRPDSLVTGGADGLIKLWSLRAPTSGRRQGPGANSVLENEGTAQQQRGRGGDALSVLTGHSGRIQCVKTAWHGDRLLSGGADRTVRVWDLAASGKCLHVLSGHSGWVTHVQYWGSNTIISGSSDRSLALWDARIRSTPLFLLRHHQAPVSDILVGARTDPLLVSAASDGSIATWDFRTLSDSDSGSNDNTGYKVARHPRAAMYHHTPTKTMMTTTTTTSTRLTQSIATGPVFLARSVLDSMRHILSVGSDAIIREWDMSSGTSVEGTERRTGHSDAISNFQVCYGQGSRLSSETDYRTESLLDGGIISSSWDGTVRLRRKETVGDA